MTCWIFEQVAKIIRITYIPSDIIVIEVAIRVANGDPIGKSTE